MKENSRSIWEHKRQSLKIFNEQGGKFRLSIINRCNLDCFFCHNEGMANPRNAEDRPNVTGPPFMAAEEALKIINAYTALGGKQLNITGGEPLIHPEIVEILEGIERRDCHICLNTNVLDASVLLDRPVFNSLSSLLISLHTTDEQHFEKNMGRPGVDKVMANILALKEHGYKVVVSSSIGHHNKDDFPDILDFVIDNDISAKAIALVRSSDREGFYGSDDWFNPWGLADHLLAKDAIKGSTVNALGGQKTNWRLGDWKYSVKNVSEGRLVTDYCRGCPYMDYCGEGIYGLRVGVDRLFKPCLLNREKYRPFDATLSYEDQILSMIDAMIGDWSRAQFVVGEPV